MKKVRIAKLLILDHTNNSAVADIIIATVMLSSLNNLFSIPKRRRKHGGENFNLLHLRKGQRQGSSSQGNSGGFRAVGSEAEITCGALV